MTKKLTTALAAGEPAWRRPAETSFLLRTAPALAVRDYRMFWFSQLAVNVAVYMMIVARSWVVFELTGSAMWVGLTAFASGFFMFGLGPLGGVIADRLYRRQAVMAAQIASVLQALGFGLLLATDTIEVWHFVALGVVSGAMWGLAAASVQVVIADILEERHLANGIGLNMASWGIAGIVGPLAAGFLLSSESLGADATYFIMAGLFGLSVLLLSRVSARASASPRKPSGVARELGEGLRYVRESPAIMILVGLLFAMTFFGLSFLVLLPALADNVFHVGSRGLGYLNTMFGVGSVLGSVIAASIGGSRRVRTYLFLLGLGTGASLLLLGFSGTFALALLPIFLIGAANMAYFSLTNVLLFRVAEPEKYGRVNSLAQMTYGIVPLAGFPAGALADAVGVRVTIAGAGSLLLATVLLGALRLAGRPIERRAAAPVRGAAGGLRDLAQLRDEGLISEEEYQEQRRAPAEQL